MNGQSLVQEIEAALDAHAAWRIKLVTAIRDGTCSVPVADIACDDKCKFGQWLYGPTISGATREGKPYQVTRRLHAEFHEAAARVARMAESGARGEAYALLDGEFTARSDTLNRALKKWRDEIAQSA